MSITASLPQTVSLRADFLAATTALAHVAGRNLQLDRSSPISRAALNCLYLLNRRSSIKNSISSTRRPSDRAAPKSKSP
jgi:hypothetical protein